MSGIHLSNSGFITKSALPSIARVRGPLNTGVATIQIPADNTTANVSATNIVDISDSGLVCFNQSGQPSSVAYGPFTAQTGSVFFDGSGDAIYYGGTGDSGLVFGTGDFTIECWVYILTYGANYFCDFRPNGDNLGATHINLYFSGTAGTNYLRLYVNGADRLVGNTSISTNSWTHIALVRISGVTKMYVGGVQQTATWTDSTNYTAGTARPIIGGGNTNTNQTANQFRGYMSNVRMVKGVGVYTGNFTPPTTKLNATQTGSGNIATISGSSTSLLLRDYNPRAGSDATGTNNCFLVPASSTYATTGGCVNFHPYTSASSAGSYYFDGTNFVDSVGPTAADNFSGQFTIEMWVYPTTSGTLRTVASRTGASNAASSWKIDITATNGVQATFYNASTATTTTATGANTVPTGAWTHIAFVRDSGLTNVKTYVNGVNLYTNTFSATVNNVSTPSRIGALINTTGTAGTSLGASQYFTGYVTGVRIIRGIGVYTGVTFSTPVVQPLALTCATSTGSYTSTTNINTTDTTTAALLFKFDNWVMTSYTDATQGGYPLPVILGGTATTTPAFSKFGGSSLSMGSNPTRSYAWIASTYTLTGAFTIECWCYVTSWSTRAMIACIGNMNSVANAYEFYISTGGAIIAGAPGGSPTTVTFGSISTASYTNTWFHIAFTRNGSGLWQCWVNGTQIGSGSSTYALNQVGNNGGVYIGCTHTYSAASTEGLAGYIDDFRIVPQQVYTANFTAPTAALANSSIAVYSTVTNTVYGMKQAS